MTEVEQQAPAPTTEAPAKEEVVEEKKVEAEAENKEEEKKDEEKKEEPEKEVLEPDILLHTFQFYRLENIYDNLKLTSWLFLELKFEHKPMNYDDVMSLNALYNNLCYYLK